ncbi:MAG: type II secretion system F family protein [Alphaproteobacteria bacterium]
MFYLLTFLITIIAIFGITFLLANKYDKQQNLQKRLEIIVGKKNVKDDKVFDTNSYRRKKIQDNLKQLEDTQKPNSKHSIKSLLMQANLKISPLHFWLLSILFGLLVTGLWVAIKGFSFVACLIWFYSTFGFPKRYLKKRCFKRQKAFTSNFADAIDIIVRGIRSGLPVGECIKMIGKEMPDPVGQEFRLIVEGQKIGLTINEIMQRALERMPTDDFRFFSVVITIQQQTGGNLAETLEKLSDVLRGRKKMKDKIQALSSEAKASAMIIGSLPFFMIVILKIIAPDYVGILFEETIGHVMLICGAIWMIIGTLVMKNMINFDF